MTEYITRVNGLYKYTREGLSGSGPSPTLAFRAWNYIWWNRDIAGIVKELEQQQWDNRL